LTTPSTPAGGSGNLLVDEPAAGVKRITFNRPATLNAFPTPMFAELHDLLEAIRFDPYTRVVILTGAGRGFCSGADVSEVANTVTPASMDAAGEGAPASADHEIGPIPRHMYALESLNRITVLIRSMPQPVIAAVNGPAAGAGYSMALACDITIAAQSASFVNAIHRAQTGPELGLSYLLQRAVGAQRAGELLLTARPVLADEAYRIGLVSRTVPDERLMDVALEIAEAVMVNTPVGAWLTKRTLWQSGDAASLEQAIQFEMRATVISVQTGDAKEKSAALREGRPPQYRMT
jgi:enoyl-CoA hydratase